MIKTYDEALKTMSNVRNYLAINRADDCVEELDKVARYFINEKHKENPTLSDCIKMWEERGYEVELFEKSLTIQTTKKCYVPLRDRNCHNKQRFKRISISFYLLEILYKASYIDNDEPCYLNLEEHHLLTQTLKALEEMKDE